MAKAVFIGIDGCDATVVEKLSKNQVIESFWEKIFIPVFQPSNDRGWASIFTGADASFHGGFYWRPTENSYALNENFNASMYMLPPIWEQLSKKNLPVGIIGVPTTYPAKPVKGFWIAAGGGGSKLSAEDTCYPILAREIIETTEYIFDLRFPDYVHKTPVEFVNRLTSVEKLRWAAAKKLIDRFGPLSFLGIVFKGMDIIQHFFWDRVTTLFSAGKLHDKLDEAIAGYYQELFKLAKEIVNFFSSDTLVIASDHGFCGYEKEINITKILADEDFVVNKRLQMKTMGKNTIKKLIPHSLFAQLRVIQRKVQMGGVWQLSPPELDWARSKAIPFKGLSGIYLNRSDRSPIDLINEDRVQKVIESLCEYLAAITDSQNGEHLFQNVKARNDVYKGPERNLAPDILFEVPRGYRIETDMPINDPFVRKHRILSTSESFMPGQGHIGIHAPTACAAVFNDGILVDNTKIASLDGLYTVLMGGVK